MEKKFDIYEMITERVIEQMKKGNIPWKQPWFNVNDGAFSHRDGKCYSLLNQCMLGDDHEYITFKEIQAEHGKLKKGSKAKYVVFWSIFKKTVKEKDKNGNMVEKEHTFPILKYYRVFDIADTEGIKPRAKRVGTAEEKPEAEKIIKDYISRSGVKLTRSRTSNVAFYSPLTDSITVPCKKQYDVTAEYYSTLFHEMTHSTGHPSRLDRFETGVGAAAFGGESYSKEELVAELGAASLTNYCGLEVPESFNNSVAYLQSWLSALKNDRRLIVSATSRAQKAVNMILGIEPEKKEKTGPQEQNPAVSASEERYEYLMKNRPPAPGAVPRQKDMRIEEVFDERTERHGVMCWAVISYPTPLTFDEIKRYELMAC